MVYDFDCFALMHRAVAVRHFIDAYGLVEHASGFDAAFQHAGEQFIYVRTNRSRAAADGSVSIEGRLPGGKSSVVRNTDAADSPAGPSDVDGCEQNG